MNIWLKKSIDYANKKSYLDDLFEVYPTLPGQDRELEKQEWQEISEAFNSNDDQKLIIHLLKLPLFPIKDSYIAYLRRDSTALQRNPQTIKRIANQLYDMGLEKIHENITKPPESNRRIGPMFSNWVQSGSLGIPNMDEESFLKTNDDAILLGGDSSKKQFAKKHLNYNGDQGLDFVARVNHQMIIGEAKFITDFGGHQNQQFNGAMRLLESSADAIKIALLDGVIYIEGRNKMHMTMTNEYKNRNIMSALFLKEFLESL